MNPLDSDLHLALPLREPTFYILLSLANSTLHGYAIMKSIEQLSRGQLKLSTGTLYEALARMADQNWIERADVPAFEDSSETDSNSKTRKAYRISPLGIRILQAELNRMQALIDTARQHLKVPE